MPSVVDEVLAFPTDKPAPLARQPRVAPKAAEPERRRSYLSAAVVSLAVHLALMAILLLVPGLVPRRSEAVVVRTELNELTEELQFAYVIDLDREETGNSPLSATSPAATATPAGELAEEDPADQLPEDLLPDPELPSVARLELPRSEELTAVVNVEGVSGEYVGGVEGAVDRITIEILRSLERNKTLVIWIFDSTESLRDEREAIARRFERVYRELGLLGQTDPEVLLTAIVAFGKGTHFMTDKPIADVARLREAVRKIPPDETGEEHVFTAIHEAARKYASYRTRGKRDIMMIVVTDEAGDDEGRVDDVLPVLEKLKARVYVLGAEAVFGRRTITVPYRDEKGRVLGYPEVTRGPESATVEIGFMPYWFGGGPSLLRSGFGTWALTRLCRETGGIYFLVDYGDISGERFDPFQLQPFAPEYCSRREYMARASRSRFRSTILQVAKMLKVRTQAPRLVFPAYNRDVMSNAMKQAQGTAAILKAQVDPIVSLLASVEAERAKETSLRWRAHYDLLFGRALATKVRAYTYNALLAQMRVKPKKFANEKNNTWRLVPDETIPEDTPAGYALVEAAKKAREYLRRCVEQYRGTPWALLAERELQQPLGFRWEEMYTPPPAPRRAQPNRPNRNRPNPNRPNNRPRPKPVPKKI